MKVPAPKLGATKLEWALYWAARGWRVFPLNGKVPIPKAWQMRATDDPDRIREWWAQLPDANIGGVMDDRICIDIDAGRAGFETFVELQSSHLFPETLSHGTGGGGRHLIYSGNGLKSGNDRLGPGIDVKAGPGAYIVLPGSVHPDTGKVYEIEIDRPEAPLPQEVVDAVASRPKASALAAGDSIAGAVGDRIPAGQRDEVLFRYAARLRRKGLSKDEARALMGRRWRDCDQPPDDEFPLDAALRKLDQVWERYPSGVSSKRAMRDSLLTSEQLRALPPPRPLLGNLLMQETLAVLFGQPGAGKSFVAIDWALSVAAGGEWFGQETQRGRVLYIAGEGVSGLSVREAAWTKARGRDTTGHMWWLPQAVNLLDDTDVSALAEIVAEVEPVLIVFDTLARSLVGGDENSAQDVGRAIDRADGLRQVTPCTVLLVHHSRKDGLEIRGSSALQGAADTIIEVRGDGTNLALVCKKQKDAPRSRRCRCN